MKTKVEINGYEIEIEERDGLISVTATFEDEVVEEFQIETEEGQGGDEEGQEDVQGFDEFGQDEEEDFGQDDEEGQEDDEDEEEEGQNEMEGKLESFQAFINKKK